MKISITSIVLIIAFSTQAFAQGDLHVKGKIRSDSLANANYLLIYADSTGTLDTLPAGLPGQVLISNGQGGKPYWSDITGGQSVLYANYTSVGTDADILEKTLASYILPANTIDSSNKKIEITFSGTIAANNNNKTIRLKFGGNDILLLLSALSNRNFIGDFDITRTTANTSKLIGYFSVESVAPTGQIVNTYPVDFTNNIVIELTGKNSVPSANDIVLEGIMIRLIK